MFESKQNKKNITNASWQHDKAAFFQAKLTINKPGDEYEQEADAVADKVMRMPDRTPRNNLFFQPAISAIQRKCAHCEEQEKQQLQRKETNNSAVTRDQELDSYVENLSGRGQRLPKEVQNFFEPKFGYDFSNVKVHTDTTAANSAQSINALAYTSGNNMVFNKGQYQPETNTGKKLLAHELTHVVQQGSLIKKVQRMESEEESSSSEVSTPPNTDASLKSGIAFDAIELPSDEAARRVNQALDVMTGLTYVRRPSSSSSDIISANEPEAPGEESSLIQTFPANHIQRESGGSSFLAKVKGGVVGSIQICADVLTGACKIKGWIWAGVGYEAPYVGWLGGYYFGEKVWWEGNSDKLKLFEPGTCRSDCEKAKTVEAEKGWGVAGFPWEIKPNKQRARFNKAGVEIGVLITPNSFCDGDLEFIALINLLQYIGPVATVITKAVEGINVVTHDTPHVGLQAGIDISATFHICRGENSLFAINHADLCGGGYIDGGLGLSHSKEGNHGAS